MTYFTRCLNRYDPELIRTNGLLLRFLNRTASLVFCFCHVTFQRLTLLWSECLRRLPRSFNWKAVDILRLLCPFFCHYVKVIQLIPWIISSLRDCDVFIRFWPKIDTEALLAINWDVALDWFYADQLCCDSLAGQSIFAVFMVEFGVFTFLIEFSSRVFTRYTPCALKREILEDGLCDCKHDISRTDEWIEVKNGT